MLLDRSKDVDNWALNKYSEWYNNLSEEDANYIQTYTINGGAGCLWNLFLHSAGGEKYLETLYANGINKISTNKFSPCIGNNIPIETLGYTNIANALSKSKVGYYDDASKKPIILYHSYEFYEYEITRQLKEILELGDDKTFKDFDLTTIDSLDVSKLVGKDITSSGFWSSSTDSEFINSWFLRGWNGWVGEAWNVCPVYEVELDTDMQGAYLSNQEIIKNGKPLAHHDEYQFMVNKNFKISVSSVEKIAREDEKGKFYVMYIKCKASML